MTYKQKNLLLDLFFGLIPIVAVLAAFIYANYGSYIGLICLYPVLALTPVFFIKFQCFNRTFAIWSISVSLLYSTAFGMSWNYIWGFDINFEYYFANQVLSSGFWDAAIPSAGNSVASVTLLAPMLSLILDLDLIQILKIVYPLMFSFVPVFLVKTYERILKNRLLAELSVLFFMFFFTFFTEMLALARQMIAEVFLAMLLLIMVRKIHPVIIAFFLISLATSHYGVAFLTMFALFSLLSLKFLKIKHNLSLSNVALFSVAVLLWYSFAGGGFQFNNLVKIGLSISKFLGELLNPAYSQGMTILLDYYTPLRQAAKYVNVGSQALISLGIVYFTFWCFIKREKKCRYYDFLIVSLIFFGYNIAGIIVPFFGSQLNVPRLYQISLVFLSPFFLVGASFVYKFSLRFFRKKGKKNENSKKALTKYVAAFLMIYFLFNSGFLLVVGGDPTPPQWLDRHHSPSWTSQEVSAAFWIKFYVPAEYVVYLEEFKFPLFLGLGLETRRFGEYPSIIFSDIYETIVYLGKDTVCEGQLQAFYYDLSGIAKYQYLTFKNTTLYYQIQVLNLIYYSDEVIIYNR